MNVLLAVDQSEASAKAVRFAADLLAGGARKDLAVTLVHAVESLPEIVLSHAGTGADDPVRQATQQWVEQQNAQGQQLLDRHRQTLVDAGIPASAVRTRVLARSAEPQARKVVAAIAIIEEMKANPYDIVCLGRRGDAQLAGTFVGSVAEKVLREAQGKSVWVVD